VTDSREAGTGNGFSRRADLRKTRHAVVAVPGPESWEPRLSAKNRLVADAMLTSPAPTLLTGIVCTGGTDREDCA